MPLMLLPAIFNLLLVIYSHYIINRRLFAHRNSTTGVATAVFAALADFIDEDNSRDLACILDIGMFVRSGICYRDSFIRIRVEYIHRSPRYMEERTGNRCEMGVINSFRACSH